MFRLNADIKMFNRKIYVPIMATDEYAVYVKGNPDNAIVVTFKDKNDINSAEIVDGAKAEDIAVDWIETINGEMMKDENVTIAHAPVRQPITKFYIIE